MALSGFGIRRRGVWLAATVIITIVIIIIVIP